MNILVPLLVTFAGATAIADEASLFATEPVVSANPNPRVPLAAVLKFRPTEAVRTRLTVSDGEETWQRWFVSDADPANGLPILGMHPGRRHTIRVAVQTEGGPLEEYPRELHFLTPTLPADSAEWPSILVPVSETDRLEPGVTLLSVRRRTPQRGYRMTRQQRDFTEDWGLILGLDARGEVVWYYSSDQRIAGIDRLHNGNVIFHLADFRTVEIDMLGNTVREFYPEDRPWGPREGAIPIEGMQTLHHQPHELPNGNYLAFSANARTIENYYTSETDPDAPRATQKVVGDTIVEFTPEGEIVWSWNAFEHLDIQRIGYDTFDPYWYPRGFPGHLDWTHGNGISYDDRDDSVVFYLKHQDAVFKVDRKTKEIKWIFGEPTGWSPELEKKVLEPVGELIWPFHAHNPRLSDAGTIVMYDNGHWRARPFTGAVPVSANEAFSSGAEFVVDEESMTVRQVWRSHTEKSEDSCFANGMGDAHRLPRTGNMLVIDPVCFDQDSHELTLSNWDFSKLHPIELTHIARIREYTRTEPAQVLWEVILRDRHGVLQWQVYGGLRVNGLYPDTTESR